MRRPVLLAVLVAAAAALLQRRARSGRADKDLWTEATTTPDLR